VNCNGDAVSTASLEIILFASVNVLAACVENDANSRLAAGTNGKFSLPASRNLTGAVGKT